MMARQERLDRAMAGAAPSGFSLSAAQASTDIATPEVSPRPLVLLADPDEETRRLYAAYLERHAFATEQADNGPEALAKALASRPSVLVTETRLPTISGYDLCRLVRSDTLTMHVTIVVVAGDVSPADRGTGVPLNADAVLAKPCLPQTLLDEIRRLRHTAAAPVVTEGRYGLSRAHTRVTTTSPPTTPARLICPECDRVLAYRRSHIGGISVKQSERWDDYVCGSGCGAFEYRQRTRALRRVL